MAVIDLNNDNFYEQLMLCEKPALVDFYADWCAPCKRMALLLEELSEQNTDVVFFRLNVDMSRETAHDYGVRLLPSLLLFVDGQETGRKIGTCTSEELIIFMQEGNESENNGSTPEPEQGNS